MFAGLSTNEISELNSDIELTPTNSQSAVPVKYITRPPTPSFVEKSYVLPIKDTNDLGQLHTIDGNIRILETNLNIISKNINDILSLQKILIHQKTKPLPLYLMLICVLLLGITILIFEILQFTTL